jgi:peptidoglycan-associated lipoprotein
VTTFQQPTTRLALTALMLTVLAACSSTPPAAPATPAPAPVVTAPAPAAPVAKAPAPAPTPTPAPVADTKPAPSTNLQSKALPAHLDPNSDISRQRSVYFDFDRAVVKPEATPVIQSHGKYLAANPTLAIRIEGNTDERGSSEYNLALGNKRAEAVRQALKLIGARDSQMEAISYGELHPKASGHDEAAWSQNRRADLQYPAK